MGISTNKFQAKKNGVRILGIISPLELQSGPSNQNPGQSDPNLYCTAPLRFVSVYDEGIFKLNEVP